MKRQSIEDYQREQRERRQREVAAVEPILPVAQTSPGDEDRKQRVLARGLECMRRIKGDQTWEDWLGIGEAMMVITEEAMAEVAVAVWDGNNKRLTREFMSRWEEYERRGTNDPRQKPLSKQERWALREVMTTPDIGAWRATLDGVNRRKLNHPNKVIERWRRATQVSDKEPKKPSPSMSQALKERGKVIEEQEARIKELAEELEGTRGGPPTLTETLDALLECLGGDASEGDVRFILESIAEVYNLSITVTGEESEPSKPGRKKRDKKNAEPKRKRKKASQPATEPH
jgi:hypothetical protein